MNMPSTFNQKRVLVTGATGFIGSHLVRKLVEMGAEVSIFTSSGKTERIRDIQDKVVIQKVDLTNCEQVQQAVAQIQPSIVFHLASFVNPEREYEYIDKCLHANLNGTLNLFRALHGTKVECIVNTGTCEEYGDGPTPFREEQTPSPVSPYSASKVASTYFAQMMYKTFNMPIVTLRPFLTYGGGQEEGRLIPSLILRGLRKEPINVTKGEQTRDFIYVEDVVDAYIRASQTPAALGEIINIGTGKEIPIQLVVSTIAKKMNIPSQKINTTLPYRSGEVMHFYPRISKAKKILNWSPRTSFEEGIEKTINWYREHYARKEMI